MVEEKVGAVTHWLEFGTVTIVTRLGRWGNLSPLPSNGGNNPGLPNLELARLTEISELEEPKLVWGKGHRPILPPHP